MRVTFILPYASLAGGLRVVAIYAQELARRGHQVVFVSVPRRGPGWRGKVKSVLRGQGWPPSPRREPSHLDGLPIEHRILQSWRPVVDADVPDADVVIATWWETAEWVAALGPAKGAKVYFIQADDRLWVPQTNDPRYLRCSATWRLPMHLICVTASLRDLLIEETGASEVDVVPNSVDTRQFDAPPRDRQAQPTVGMVYTSHFSKGCDLGFKALALAGATLPGIKLMAFGAYDPDSAVPLPPGSSYTLRPAQEQMRAIYSQCDLWLFCSRQEGFGLPILEAMACRTPVVGTPARAVPELLADGGGVLVSNPDAPALARGIAQVLGLSNPQWRAMSDAAYATARRYSWKDAADRFEAALIRGCQRSLRGELVIPRKHAG